MRVDTDLPDHLIEPMKEEMKYSKRSKRAIGAAAIEDYLRKMKKERIKKEKEFEK